MKIDVVNLDGIEIASGGEGVDKYTQAVTVTPIQAGDQ